MKLDAEKLTVIVLNRCKFGVFAAGHGAVAGGHFEQLVAVGIPHARGLRHVLEERAFGIDRQCAEAVFALFSARDFTTKNQRHQVDAVADAEDRHAELEDVLVRERRLGRIHARRSAGEDHAAHAGLLELGGGRRIMEDPGIDVALADATGDDLRVLRSEIQNGDSLRHGNGCLGFVVGKMAVG